MNQFVYLAVAALIAGIGLFSLSSKERNEKGEWGDGLQWGYLLMMVGVFGVLAVKLSFTAVLLIFVAFTGAVWLWRKLSFKPTRQVQTDEKGQKILTGSLDDENHFRDYMAGFFPIILAVFVLRTFVAEPFQIPSSSMRPGLVKGDFILVNKFAYGIRTPIVNNVLIDTGKVERGDVVVFNYPLEPSVNYIKRAVGLPGDTVEYKDKVLKVNGSIVETDTEAGAYAYPHDDNPQQTVEARRFAADFSGRNFDVLKADGVPSVSTESLGNYVFTADSQGKKAQTDIQHQNCRYEEDGSGFTCTVPQGSYFMMGDNRDHSADSRYWGFVDDKLIVGKAFFIWMNLGELGRIGSGIR
ncbi:signal peptidase I [Neisseria sp. 23W00296]|uniref:signal peptidase I n=1 Tax=unclassified Neisseria TaxID=2623750 RepID=UPI0002A3CC8C|nr:MULTISPECIES: signal peptidase I [unclassified Neisseria]ASP18432.1 S26 family signal peptidase [Neisseria sp. KEM232]EKY10477.1 signal peptidase I [Neisseria sp. oral taxon 020 str. F0370]